MAIVLNNVTSGYNLATINSNFQKIEDYVNDKLLARADTGVAGEAMMERALDMNGNKILNIFVDVNDANSLLTVGAADNRYYNVSGDTLTGPMDANGQSINNVPSPVSSSNPATKGYVDNADNILSGRISDLSNLENINNQKSLRFPDVVAEMPDVVTRANSLQGYNAQGKPVPIFTVTDTADLALKLASATGGNLVGVVQGGTVQDAIGSTVSVKAFGAKGDFNPSTKTGTDDTAAFKAAIAAAISGGYRNVYVPAGHYLITDELNIGGDSFTSGEGTRDYWRGITQGVHIYGDGPYSTILVFNPPSTDTPCLSARGGWGTHSPRAISSLAIEPLDWADYNVDTTGTGILLQGCCFVPVTDVHIGRFHRGIHLWNLLQGPTDTTNTFTLGDFTEFNRMTRVRIFNADIGADFQVTKGNNSFHGNSWTDCMVQINAYGGIGLRMWDDGTKATVLAPTNPMYQYIANVYNNNFDINFFGSDSQTCYLMSLIRAQGRGCSGTMTVEGAVTLKTDTYEWFQSFGSLHSISAIDSSVGATDTATRPVAFMWNNAAYPQANFDGTDTILTSSSLPRQYDLNNSGNTGMDLLNVRGAQSGNIWSQLSSSVSVGWLFTTRTASLSRPGQRTVWQFSYNGQQIKAPSSTTVGLYNSTVGINLTGTALVPSADSVLNLGAASLRWTAGFFGGWNVGTGGIVPVADSSYNIGSSSLRVNRSYVIARYYTATQFDASGSGSPEGVLAASVGSTYRRTDGGASTSFYVKESGTGNTGWVGK